MFWTKLIETKTDVHREYTSKTKKMLNQLNLYCVNSKNQIQKNGLFKKKKKNDYFDFLSMMEE